MMTIKMYSYFTPFLTRFTILRYYFSFLRQFNAVSGKILLRQLNSVFKVAQFQ